MGFLLPTLVALKTKLHQVGTDVQLTVPLVDALIATGHRQEIWPVFYRTEFILASITLSVFRLRWVDNKETKIKYRQLLPDAMVAMSRNTKNVGNPEQSTQGHDKHGESETSDDGFFLRLTTVCTTVLRHQAKQLKWKCF
jgi:hypothetical protein